MLNPKPLSPFRFSSNKTLKQNTNSTNGKAIQYYLKKKKKNEFKIKFRKIFHKSPPNDFLVSTATFLRVSLKRPMRVNKNKKRCIHLLKCSKRETRLCPSFGKFDKQVTTGYFILSAISCCIRFQQPCSQITVSRSSCRYYFLSSGCVNVNVANRENWWPVNALDQA